MPSQLEVGDILPRYDTSDIALEQRLYLSLVIPVAIELLFYGSFIVLFGLSLYVFRHKYTPCKVYILSPFIYFVIATVAVILDLVMRCISPLNVPLSLTGTTTPTTHPPDVVLKLQLTLFFIMMTKNLMGVGLLAFQTYRLFGSKKRYIILPVFSILTILALGLLYAILSLKKMTVSTTLLGVVNLGILAQVSLVTGLVAGRIWWLNRASQSTRGEINAFRSLSMPIIESGLFFAAVFLLWVILSFVQDKWGGIISPCALIQSSCISSTLIIVRIGLGVDALSETENVSESKATPDGPIQRRIRIGDITEPFRLKYDLEQPPSLPTHNSSTRLKPSLVFTV